LKQSARVDARTDPNHRTNGPVSCSDRLPKLALLLHSPVTHTRGGKSVMERTSRDARTSALFIAGVDGVGKLSESVNYAEMFYLVDAGEGRWTVKHATTNEYAGTLLRTTQGVVLRNEQERFIGTFPSVETALRNLYALA
jgi:hypothetical protein